jgi:hypothetical protein
VVGLAESRMQTHANAIVMLYNISSGVVAVAIGLFEILSASRTGLHVDK